MLYIVVMSIAGSILVACYLLMERFKLAFFSAQLKYLILKCAIFFYIVPLVGLDYIYRDWWYCIPANPETEARRLEKVSGELYFIRVEGTVRGNFKYDMLMLSLVLWLLVAISLLCIGIIRYLQKTKRLMTACTMVTDTVCLEQLAAIRKEYKIKRKIRLYECAEVASSFTLGVFRLCVFMDAGADELQREIILRHELTHIRRNDVLVKQLATLTNYVQWFNPLSYKLQKWVDAACEFACDAEVVENADATFKQQYAFLMIRSMKRNKSNRMAFGSGFAENTASTEKRVRAIVDMRKRKRWERVLTGVFVAVLILADSLTVFAYPHVTVMEGDDIGAYGPGVRDYFVTEDKVDEMNAYWGIVEYTILYDDQFVDEDGNIYEITGNEVAPCAEHTHHYVTGQRQRHEENDNGGCTVYVYSIQRCTRCGHLIMGELINVQTNTVCPH